MPSDSRSWIIDILIMTILISLIYGALLQNRPLTPPDEGRYSEIPREMVASGDYVTPHLNGIKYFEKPPLFYWLQTFSIKIAGLHEWSLRLMTEIMGLLGCLITYIGTRKLYSRATALLATLILGSASFYVGLAHFITLDMTVTTFLTGSLLSFLVGTRYPPGNKRRYAMWSMFAFAALATLTKGLIGILFPGMIIFSWILLNRQWKELPTYCIASGTCLFLLITLPWHILVQLQNPEFFNFYFIEQHFLRYLTNYADRREPFWFLPLVLTVGFFPWTGFAFAAFKNACQSFKNPRLYSIETFLLLWTALIFLFYWLSHSQLSPYILPIFPPLAILTGKYLRDHWSEKTKGLSFGFITASVFSFIIAGFLLFKMHYGHPFKLSLAADVIILIPILFTASGLVYHYKGTKAGITFLTRTTIFFLFIISMYYTALETRSVKPLAEKLLTLSKPSDEIFNYNHYYQDLTFYLERGVKIVNWSDELTFGRQHQDARHVFYDDAKLFKEWPTDNRKFMIIDKNDLPMMQKKFPNNSFLIAGCGKNYLICNQEIQP